jgi:hypothetical protein
VLPPLRKLSERLMLGIDRLAGGGARYQLLLLVTG